LFISNPAGAPSDWYNQFSLCHCIDITAVKSQEKYQFCGYFWGNRGLCEQWANAGYPAAKIRPLHARRRGEHQHDGTVQVTFASGGGLSTVKSRSGSRL